jgi:hypothetical protein
MKPITKNIIVIDENNVKHNSTYLRRAKGLVKNGRARWVDDNTICLTELCSVVEPCSVSCPPLNKNITEDLSVNNINNIKEKMIAFLFENANPSIKYRIKSEILNNITAHEAAIYQEQILTEPILQKITAIQKENGWIENGSIRHFDMPEGAIKYLAEKAVDKNTPVLKRAMDAYSEYCSNYKKNGFDEFKYPCSGMNLHCCACLARVGYDDTVDISPQIQLAVDSFKRVREIDSVFDILHLEKTRGKERQVFNDYEKWPCRHHLDMLAHTNSWKSEENIKAVAESVNKMMRTDNPKLVSYVPNGQAGTGCAGGVFPAQGLTVMGSGIYPSPILTPGVKNGYYHFELIEWFARCGIVSFIPALNKIVGEIADSIDDGGVCRLPMVAESVFKNWNQFGGLQLEVDWRSKTRRDCDVTFRALLIVHYANIAL